MEREVLDGVARQTVWIYQSIPSISDSHWYAILQDLQYRAVEQLAWMADDHTGATSSVDGNGALGDGATLERSRMPQPYLGNQHGYQDKPSKAAILLYFKPVCLKSL